MKAGSEYADISCRREVSDWEVEAALDALNRNPRRILAADWPNGLVNLDQPGLYAWWVDGEGARELTRGISEEGKDLQIVPGRIYVGQAGATSWPSGRRFNSTLFSRIGNSHFGSSIGSSSLRRTLARQATTMI